MGVPPSLAFACLSYGGNDRKRGNNLLLKYENETPEAFFLISIKCYPLCATLPLAHGARIFASLSENPQNSAVGPTSALGIPACWAKLPNGFCSAFQHVNVLLAAACRLWLKLPCARLFLPIPPRRRGCIARAPPLLPVSASLVFHTSTRFFPSPEEFPSFLFA